MYQFGLYTNTYKCAVWFDMLCANQHVVCLFLKIQYIVEVFKFSILVILRFQNISLQCLYTTIVNHMWTKKPLTLKNLYTYIECN